MDWVDGGAGRLRVEKTGSGAGTPVLLVHGGGADRSHWHALLPLLATDRTVVAFDQRGYGESAPPSDGRRELAAMARTWSRSPPARAWADPVLVGHSYGGAVVAEAVARSRDRFAGVVFLDRRRGCPESSRGGVAAWRASMAPERFRASSRAWFERILHDARPETRQHVLATLGLTPRETYVGSMESMLRFDPTVVRRFPGPKLVITVRTFDGPMSMRTAVPEVPNVFIEDTSHWPQLDRPEEVAAIVGRFLADVDRRRA